MGELLSTAEVAKRLGVPARIVRDAFYHGWLRRDLCPVVANRRLVPAGYVETIAQVLRSNGKAVA